MALEKVRRAAELSLVRMKAVMGKGEEATKQALVLPMLDALGYDIWNPSEVCPEYEADFAVKKAGQKEKVDIAVLVGGQPAIYLEVKAMDVALDGHEGQLARYFNATSTVRLGVLTNGIEWRFFTDTGDPNIMDSFPFHTAKLDAVDQGLDVVSRFSKQAFDSGSIRDYATELLYVSKIANLLRSELDLKDKEPSEQFIRWILKSDGMYSGVVNMNVVERFRPVVKGALTRVIREVVRRSIAAMEEEAAQSSEPVPMMPTQASPAASAAQATADSAEQEASKADIVTTEDELKFFSVASDIWQRSALPSAQVYDSAVRKYVPVSLGCKDTTGYLGVYINKPSYWILRVVFGTKASWVGFNLNESVAAPLVPEGTPRLPPSPWAPFRVGISSPTDLERFQGLFLAAAQRMVDDHAKQ